MIVIVTDNSVGGFFLDWTINYFAGSEFYSIHKDCYMPVIENPTNGKNNHRHFANQITTLAQLQKSLDRIKQEKTATVYFHPLDNSKNQVDFSLQHTKQALDLVTENTDKIIVVKNSEVLYHCKHEKRGTARSSDGKRLIEDSQEIHADFINTYFMDAKIKWQKLGLKYIWDKREFLALNFRPFDTSLFLKNCHDFDFDHFDIQTLDLWTSFDNRIQDLLQYLNLDLDNNKLEHWHNVYNIWKTYHTERLQFCWYFESIVDNIIKGNDMNLARFNLDIVREASIQHTLIYRHNLNLKTWQLEKFTNTKQLHNLLEPNTHLLKA